MTEKDEMGGMKELVGSANASFGPMLVHMMTADNIPYTTDCKRCIYRYNINPRVITDTYYCVGDMRCAYVGSENRYNITDDRCSKGMRMSKPICPLFDDGKDMK